MPYIAEVRQKLSKSQNLSFVMSEKDRFKLRAKSGLTVKETN